MIVEVPVILLAEDNPHDVELTLEALAAKHLSNQVVVVNDGVEALEFLRYEGAYAARANGRPAVMLLDIKMPRMNGLEVLQAVRSDPRLKTLPVVVLTSSREESDLMRSYELGVNAYVVKPVGFGDFMDAIGELGVFWALINEKPVGNGDHGAD